MNIKSVIAMLVFSAISLITTGANAKDIIHDAEYYVIEAQNGKRWDADDKVIKQKLSEFYARNGNKPPNIIYILLDDLGFGEIGMPGLDVIRGYGTPNINKLAQSGMSLQRMYTEPPVLPREWPF